MKKKKISIWDKFQNHIIVQAIRRSLVTLIPVVMVFAFALVLITLPIPAYYTFITTWQGGIICSFLDSIYKVTKGMFAVYMVGVLGYYMGILSKSKEPNAKYGTFLVSEGCFFILSGAGAGNYDAFGPKGMFIAIFSAVLASELYLWLSAKSRPKYLLSEGADIYLRNAVQTIFPICTVFVVFALGNYALKGIFGVESLQQLIMEAMNLLFAQIDSELISGLCYSLLSGLLWFFGIHGSDVLQTVKERTLMSAYATNTELIAAGQEPTELLNSLFFDNFVVMGGCGATLCLLLAIFLFSKRRGTRSILKMSFLPMIFNINEIMVLGLPIIYNPIFLIPFLGVPLVCFLNGYFAMSMGWVPYASGKVEWTTPIFFSGYLVTSSWSGVLLQLVNLIVGVAIYAPFVKIYDRKRNEETKDAYEEMLHSLQQAEKLRETIVLSDYSASYGWLGKAMAADLKYALEKNEMKMYYQPQYNEKDECVGAEALLRWSHPIVGMVYPPMVFCLAEETGILEEVEEWVVSKVMWDAESMQKQLERHNIKISVNVTGNTIQKDAFEKFLNKMAQQKNVASLHICIEVTEQDALFLDDSLRDRFLRIKDMGYALAVDDFSMGSTSVQYLTGNHFELLKLDGSLVKGILDNPRCCDIIESIVTLSETLGMDVIAEFVSDKEIRDKLCEIGCHLYQGWYYSPALPYEEFLEKLQK